MTTPPPASPDVTDIDQALADRAQSSGDYLAGVIAAAMLDTVGQPAKLPELLWPDEEATLIRAVWEAGLTVGYRAAKLTVQPQWTAEGLGRLRAALSEAGYTAMGRLVQRSAALHQTVETPVCRTGNTWSPWTHPADTEHGTTRDSEGHR
ncbi:hypothetical protein [Streptomyces lavendofoliae]|uniref:Uncharacterized protein n=1 Tax=Streptomyces lavendofoliae TaxID=67314 RepID=A0A918M7R8_9ACTN|nr:hypothetical protein [Streptomyces lavendofoliae]GGU61977.1 hypothetical protein GCM10010274_58430 [Streptomyces lavendofoliae]